MSDFISKLHADIELQKLATLKRVAKLHQWKPAAGFQTSDELPIEASMGTIWMRSPAGSVIEFYSYIDPAYLHDPMYEIEETQLIQVSFHMLARSDRAFLKRWDDFTLYDLDMYHRLIASLQRAGFVILLESLYQ